MKTICFLTGMEVTKDSCEKTGGRRYKYYTELLKEKDAEIIEELERCWNCHRNKPKHSERLERLKWERTDIFEKWIEATQLS